MSKLESVPPQTEETPVDDVRRVREKLSAEAGNDVHRLAAHARKVAEQMSKRLGLRPTT